MTTTVTPTASTPVQNSSPTVQEATQFVADAEKLLAELNVETNRADWIQSNFITYDTQLISAAANEKRTNAGVELAKKAARFDRLDLSFDVRRKLNLIKLALTTPGPSDPAKTKEMSRLKSKLEADYGSGKYCPTPDKCLDIEQISEIMSTSRDPRKLLDVWKGWSDTSRPAREDYRKFVELTNEGARELGYSDAGAMWRSKYDMPAEEFSAEIDRLWGQVKPLYDSLHCFVRSNLTKQYGAKIVAPDKPIPAHLLGNLWAQEWGNIYDLVAPKNSDPGFDLTSALKKKKVDSKEMVRYGERFFTSLGFDPLPKTFWERSLFEKPKDREVVCHASAWDVDDEDDLRIKMCIDINGEDFQVVHHELGHNFYQRAYNKQSFIYRDSANDGFHEAVGDAIALSVTPDYLVKVGLIDKVPPASKDLGLLLREAMDKVAFLPFGLLVDQWRWKVFSGEIAPDGYSRGWWDLREKYQGIAPAVARTEADFDPGAKYHIPANVPYTRYFLARVLQFQFHRALCEAAGQTGPLNRCSIYGSKAAGEKLNQMLSIGSSRPWPEALEKITGTRQMDATAMVDYFAPLKTWLDEKNQGKTCGW
ncbi:MAG TPA: M2 family metallopeptidase [Thermoanaerobaculia bacterium]|nr:M2 family metallopeptidase [Thermoanaerobaculia bacterium]